MPGWKLPYLQAGGLVGVLQWAVTSARLPGSTTGRWQLNIPCLNWCPKVLCHRSVTACNTSAQCYGIAVLQHVTLVHSVMTPSLYG